MVLLAILLNFTFFSILLCFVGIVTDVECSVFHSFVLNQNNTNWLLPVSKRHKDFHKNKEKTSFN